MRVAVLVPPRVEGMRFDQEDTFVQAAEVSTCLRELGHEVVTAEYADHGKKTETAILGAKPDIVLNLVEEVPEGAAFLHLPAEMLDRIGLRYTGARSRTIEALGDKRAMKAELRRAGLPTAPTVDEAPPDSTFIVKSAMEHASVGLDAASVVRGAVAARALMARKKAEFGGAWFAETYVEGREFDLAIVETAGGPIVFPPAEITFADRSGDAPRIYNFASKWAEGTDEYEAALRVFPAREEPLFSELERIALACWHLFGLTGFSHIEFRVDARTGQPFVLEVNANPCLTREAGYIMSAEAGGWTQTQVVAALLAAA
jgi:D-alanine-D-alanine ligase